jgi:GNAT superfamily N-acetyltransferase
MKISKAGNDDVPGLARLLFLMADTEERAQEATPTFASELTLWWAAHQQSHSAFVARLDGPEIVGMAWVALVPRVPRPGSMDRVSADIQSVFVTLGHRTRGIGSALVSAASQYATRLGCSRVTVHSAVRSVPLYERLGFTPSLQLMQKPPD